MENCLKQTIIDYVVQSNLASTEEEAGKLVKIRDFSYEKRLIKAGLSSLADSAFVSLGSLLIEETNAISKLSCVKNKQIIDALNCIHEQWIAENMTPELWVSNFFDRKTYKYRKMVFLPFEEIMEDLVFIKRYLEKGNKNVNYSSLETEFRKWRKGRNASDDKKVIHDFINNPSFEVDAMRSIFRLKIRLEEKLQLRDFPRSEQERLVKKLDNINRFLDSREVGKITAKSICPEVADFLIDKMFYQGIG